MIQIPQMESARTTDPNLDAFVTSALSNMAQTSEALYQEWTEDVARRSGSGLDFFRKVRALGKQTEALCSGAAKWGEPERG